MNRDRKRERESVERRVQQRKRRTRGWGENRKGEERGGVRWSKEKRERKKIGKRKRYGEGRGEEETLGSGGFIGMKRLNIVT